MNYQLYGDSYAPYNLIIYLEKNFDIISKTKEYKYLTRINKSKSKHTKI